MHKPQSKPKYRTCLCFTCDYNGNCIYCSGDCELCAIGALKIVISCKGYTKEEEYE